MNTEGKSQMPETDGPALLKDGGLPLTVWIEQLQWMGKFHEPDDAPYLAPDPIQDWTNECLPYPSMPATRQDLKELGRGLIDLAKRIQVLEQRSSVSDPRSSTPLA
jgi:hypothetical protein